VPYCGFGIIKQLYEENGPNDLWEKWVLDDPLQHFRSIMSKKKSKTYLFFHLVSQVMAGLGIK
jgi:hypothetical protein